LLQNAAGVYDQFYMYHVIVAFIWVLRYCCHSNFLHFYCFT